MINGIFTTLKVQNSTPLFFDRHHQRLEHHTKALHLPLPQNIEKKVQEFIQQEKLLTCALRIIITKEGILFEDRPLPPSSLPLSLITVPDTRDEKDKIYKTTNRIVHDQAKKFAQQQDARDAIFVQNGFLIESTIANIFSVNTKGQLITPPIEGLGLNGITRQLIMEQTDVLEEEIPLTTTAPLVVVNCLRISNVTHVDRKKIDDGDTLLHKIKSLLIKVEKREE